MAGTQGCWLEAACPSSTPRTPATSASFEVLAPPSWRPLPEAPSYFLGVYLRPAFLTHDGCQAPPLCPGPLGRCPLQFAVSWSEACGDFHCSASPPPRCPGLLPSSLPPFSTPRPLEGNEVGTGGAEWEWTQRGVLRLPTALQTRREEQDQEEVGASFGWRQWGGTEH